MIRGARSNDRRHKGEGNLQGGSESPIDHAAPTSTRTERFRPHPGPQPAPADPPGASTFVEPNVGEHGPSKRGSDRLVGKRRDLPITSATIFALRGGALGTTRAPRRDGRGFSSAQMGTQPGPPPLGGEGPNRFVAGTTSAGLELPGSRVIRSWIQVAGERSSHRRSTAND